MRPSNEQIDKMAQAMCGFCSKDKRCVLKYSAPCSKVSSQDCTCKESAEELIHKGYGDIAEYVVQVEQSKNAAFDSACKLRTATHIFEEWLKEKNMLIAELRNIIQLYENKYPCKLYQERLKVALTTCRRYEQTSFNDAKKYKITDKEELKID